MKTQIQAFVREFLTKTNDEWQKVKLDIAVRRGGVSPVDVFYKHAYTHCKDGPYGSGLTTRLTAISTSSAGRPSTTGTSASADAFLRDLAREIENATKTGGIPPSGQQIADAAEKLLKAGSYVGVDRFVDSLRAFPHLAETTVRGVMEKRVVLGEAVAAGADIAATLRRHIDPDWGGFLKTVGGVSGWCSLIYDYWLDEGGLPWALERLADRIENGVVRTTQPLQAVRVKEDSDVAIVISKFASIWQQGDLPHVDERRKQYLALYGFPLLSAARWGSLETVDPKHTFPSAFHRFLAEAMSYYRDKRNLQILPDVQSARAAFDAMVETLREGNENLRIVRPPELRAQMEYSKQVLGGFTPPPSGDPLAVLRQEWERALPVRPGVAAGQDPWRNAVNSVAMLYRWQRPNINEYLRLAEFGEVILVFSRFIAGQSSVTDEVFQAFIEVMQEPVQAYVHAYKTVSQVDLGTRGAFLGTPAEAMARRIRPPVIPPLRRSWTAEVPA